MFKGWWGWWWEWNWWYECLKDDEDDDENGTDDMNEAGPSTQKFIADKLRSEIYLQCTVKHTMYNNVHVDCTMYCVYCEQIFFFSIFSSF